MWFPHLLVSARTAPQKGLQGNGGSRAQPPSPSWGPQHHAVGWKGPLASQEDPSSAGQGWQVTTPPMYRSLLEHFPGKHGAACSLPKGACVPATGSRAVGSHPCSPAERWLPISSLVLPQQLFLSHRRRHPQFSAEALDEVCVWWSTAWFRGGHVINKSKRSLPRTGIFTCRLTGEKLDTRLLRCTLSLIRQWLQWEALPDTALIWNVFD